MAYQCEYQNEIQSALWSRGSVNLFTAASMYKGHCQTCLFTTNSKHKDKNSILVSVEYIYVNFLLKNDNNKLVVEIIWTDGPSSDRKNKYTVEILRRLSEKYNKSFT